MAAVSHSIAIKVQHLIDFLFLIADCLLNSTKGQDLCQRD